ncbi:hypothetical protein Dsin_012935 [Dipteronia sinensis]|uniref:Uncharacterized protein n=1 Tax=Dipteronia sinensis TaxID=43782 RepID=A0AAE0EA38_9ROSI|nr:hypothetical protein Dsin_012935 [Dipteronia sinensis]
MRYLSEYLDRVVMKVLIPAQGRHVGNTWSPPEPSLCKINCDAIVNEVWGCIGIDIVIRDSTDFVMAFCSQVIELLIMLMWRRRWPFLKVFSLVEIVAWLRVCLSPM